MSNFGWNSTTTDVLDGADLDGCHGVVTGASAGLGAETVRALAAHGASVTMAVRDPAKAQPVRERILQDHPAAQIDVAAVDLADLDTVAGFTDQVLADHPRIDVLINNAGIMACPHGTTRQGLELQFGTNHVGHFALTTGLLPGLLASDSARVISLSSSGHRLSDVDLDDWNFERGPYDAWSAYGRAKTANALFPVGLDRRFRDQDLRAFAVHPGSIQTELGRHLTEDTLNELIERSKAAGATSRWKSVPQGAATQVWAATSRELDGKGALYLEDCGIAEPTDDPNAMSGVRPWALDSDRADALWSVSEQILAGLGFAAS
jgi:NAD(P)-dependent dehydrogenase (short-subunit alcohol dehydrogenase family)